MAQSASLTPHNDKTQAMPRYADIADRLTQRIAQGDYAVGETLPTEIELAEHFAASRQTVRAALDVVQKLGLITRRKNAGTVVKAASAHTNYMQSLATVDDLVQFAQVHRRILQSTQSIVADKTLAAELGCAPGERWLRLSSLRVAQPKLMRSSPKTESAPVSWTDVYIDPRYTSLVQQVKKHPEMLISDLIEKKYGRSIFQIEQVVMACSVPAELAEPLQARAGSSALKVLRRYRDAAGLMPEISVSIHPEKRFQVACVLTRQSISAG
jgi:GntR family transcriptional regulator